MKQKISVTLYTEALPIDRPARALAACVREALESAFPEALIQVRGVEDADTEPREAVVFDRLAGVDREDTLAIIRVTIGT